MGNLRHIKFLRGIPTIRVCFFLFSSTEQRFSFSLYKSGYYVVSAVSPAPFSLFPMIHTYCRQRNVDIVRRQWLPHFRHLSLLVSTEKLI